MATPEAVVSEIGSKIWADRVREDAKVLVKELDTGYMRLAEILYYVYDTPENDDPDKPAIYKSWGFESFGEYAEKELGLSARKAYYLRRIWYTLNVELELDDLVRQRIINLGWSKVREISKVLNALNADRWATIGENSNFTELEAAVKNYIDEHNGSATEARESEDTPVEAKVNFERFALVDDQHENVQQALDVASKLSNSDVKSHNIDLICTDFLANNDITADEDQNRDAYLRKVENLLGVEIIAVDSVSGRLVFGEGTLVKLSEGSSE